jgi:hypothetical protein
MDFAQFGARHFSSSCIFAVHTSLVQRKHTRTMQYALRWPGESNEICFVRYSGLKLPSQPTNGHLPPNFDKASMYTTCVMVCGMTLGQIDGGDREKKGLQENFGDICAPAAFSRDLRRRFTPCFGVLWPLMRCTAAQKDFAQSVAGRELADPIRFSLDVCCAAS